MLGYVLKIALECLNHHIPTPIISEKPQPDMVIAVAMFIRLLNTLQYPYDGILDTILNPFSSLRIEDRHSLGL